ADIRWLTPGRRLLHPLPMGWSSRGNPKVLLFLHFKNDPVKLACQGFSCPKCLKKQAQKCAPWRFTQKSRSHSDLTRLRTPRCEIAVPGSHGVDTHPIREDNGLATCAKSGLCCYWRSPLPLRSYLPVVTARKRRLPCVLTAWVSGPRSATSSTWYSKRSG